MQSGENVRVSIGKLLHKSGKCLILAYDQGMEHGPTDFNAQNVDPEFIFNHALEGRYSALAVGAGLAEKYYEGAYKDVPLIVKLNMKSKLPKIDPISRQIWSVEHAVKLGAAAVGFTIYDGSPNEPTMFSEFGKIVEQAHDYGLPVVVWMYPRGPNIRELDNEVLSYSARIALELGADIVKMKFNDDVENLKWMIRCAGRTKIVISGGDKVAPEVFLNEAQKVMNAGALGMAVGRNVWQSERPFSVTKALQAVVYEGKSALEAAEYLK
jgi:fructose-bisphosphate aldolase, class I